MNSSDTAEWAKSAFGNTDLGELRRIKRLTKLAESMAKNAGESVVKPSNDPASIEAAYRFIRNGSIAPDIIADNGFNLAIDIASKCTDFLAIQDATGISFRQSRLFEEK